MSDEAYASFLDQANQDTGASKVSTQSRTASTSAVDTDVPSALQTTEQYYTSDADEPFEPVSLKWKEKHMPNENEFCVLLDHDEEVSSVSVKEFDPRGRYKGVLEAVEKAGDDGTVRVYRVRHGSTRAEYYVVGLDHGNARVVGLKAKAVES